MEKEIKNIKALIRSVLLSEPEGVPMHRLRKDYEEITCQPLPYKNLGFHSIEEMCHALNDVVRMQQVGGSYVLYAVSDERTKHVEKLIANQKKKKKPHTLSSDRYGSHHLNNLSHNRFSHSRAFPKASSPPAYRYQPPHPHVPTQNHQRTVSFAHRVQGSSESVSPVRSFTSSNAAPNNISKPARSVWDRLGKSPQIVTSSFTKEKTASFRSDVPRRVSNSDESRTISSSPPLPAAEKGEWIHPKSSAPYRHEYSESRTYSLPDLIKLARPRELVKVEGYFLGDRFRSDSRILRSGRKLNTEMVKLPLYHTTSKSSQHVTCCFSFPNWANATYKSPNDFIEGTKLKIIGEHQSDMSEHNVLVQYVEVFQPESPPAELEGSVQLKMSSLAINTPTQPHKSTEHVRENYSSEASDTSVYTDSSRNTVESPDQGYSSPIPPPINSDFPPSSSLNPIKMPKEFSSSFRSIKNLKHFYLSANNESNDQSPLDALTFTLTSFHQSNYQPTPLIPTQCKDLLCSAYHQDSSSWHRAKFLENSSPSFSHFSILFIDLGEESQVPPNYLRSFPVQFLQMRAQAILCSLPLPPDLASDPNNASDPHLISIFRKLVSKGPLKIRLKNVVDGKYEVDITTASDANVLSEIMLAATNSNRNSQTSIRSRNSSGIVSQISPTMFRPNGYAKDVFLPLFSPPPTNSSAPIPPEQLVPVSVPPVLSLPPRLHISTAIPSPQISPSPLFSPLFQPPSVPLKGYSYPQGPITNATPSKLPDELSKLVTFEPLPVSGSRNTFPVKITSINSPDKFYVQNYDKTQELTDLTSNIQFYCKANKQEHSVYPVLEFCLAECSPDEWARVQVISWNQTKLEARVFLLDYGSVKIVPLHKLLKLTANHLKLAFQAISVNLNGVSPVENSWSEDSLAYFKELTLDKAMWACHKHTNSIVLVITGNGPDICIHERLISRGLAQASN